MARKPNRKRSSTREDWRPARKVTAGGDDLASAIDNAYRGVAKIGFEGMHYRTDIGRKGLARPLLHNRTT